MLEADYSAISGAGADFESIAQGLADVDVAGPFAQVQDALVGSQTSQACLWLGTRVGASVQVYAENVRALSQLATATVDSYQHTDEVQGRQFGRAVR